MDEESGILIAGRWAAEGEEVRVYSPFDGSVVGKLWRATAEGLEEAIAGAVSAFEVTRRLPAEERHRMLLSVAKYIADRKPDFASIIALEAGKPIRTARV